MVSCVDAWVILLRWSCLLLLPPADRWRCPEICAPEQQRHYKYRPEDMVQFSKVKQVYMCEKLALCCFKT